MTDGHDRISPQVVVWDFNGTILDDQPLCQSIINKMLSSRGVSPLSREDYLSVFDFPVSDYYSKVGFDLNQEPFALLAEEYMADYQPRSFDCSLRHGVLETLSAIRSLGVRQVLLSATQQAFLEKQVRYYNLAQYFHQVIGLNNTLGSSKVERARTWAKARQLDTRRSLLVGDTTHDYEVAVQLGCNCLLLTGGHNAAKRLSATGAAVAGHPRAVLQVLSG